MMEKKMEAHSRCLTRWELRWYIVCSGHAGFVVLTVRVMSDCIPLKSVAAVEPCLIFDLCSKGTGISTPSRVSC